MNGHKFALSAIFTGSDNYTHPVLMYETDDEIYYVDLMKDDNQRPYRVSTSNTNYRNLKFDIQYPITKEIESEIKRMIEVDGIWKKLQTTDIRTILNKKFVFANAMGGFLNTLIRSRQNGIVWGPGGYGKSEMIQFLIQETGLSDRAFTKSMGEGLSEAGLYGGINMREIKDTGLLKYNVEQAFVNKEIVVFEELFDAPTVVLLALKDTLQSGMVRNGGQEVPIKCKTIIGLTNIDPDEIAKTNNSYEALLQRFPMSLELKWENHRAEEYTALINKNYGSSPILAKLSEVNRKFFINGYCELIAKASRGEKKVSPRIAGKGFEVILGSIENTGDVVDRYQHFSGLQHVRGLGKVTEDITDRLKDIDQITKSQELIDTIKNEYKELLEIYTNIDIQDHVKVNEFMAKVKLFIQKHLNEKYHDKHIREYQNIINSVNGWSDAIKNRITVTSLSKYNIA